MSEKEVQNMENEIIIEDCDCEDFPVSYCKKCGRFYVKDADGLEEIDIKGEEYGK